MHVRKPPKQGSGPILPPSNPNLPPKQPRAALSCTPPVATGQKEIWIPSTPEGGEMESEQSKRDNAKKEAADSVLKQYRSMEI